MKIRIYNARILPMTEEKAGHFQIVGRGNPDYRR